jgi:hypothetical protein
LITEPRLLKATNDGSSNFIIYTLGPGLEELELLVNEIGPISGSYPVNFLEGNDFQYMRVEAEGNWSLGLSDITTARPWDGSTTTGAGSDVLLYQGGAGILEYANSGDSNFILYSYGDDADLLVNEIGPVTGQTTITAGALIVTVDAEGDWSLTVKPV